MCIIPFICLLIISIDHKNVVSINGRFLLDSEYYFILVIRINNIENRINIIFNDYFFLFHQR